MNTKYKMSNEFISNLTLVADIQMYSTVLTLYISLVYTARNY